MIPGDTATLCGSVPPRTGTIARIAGKFAHFQGGGIWRLDCLRISSKVVETKADLIVKSVTIEGESKRPDVALERCTEPRYTAQGRADAS